MKNIKGSTFFPKLNQARLDSLYEQKIEIEDKFIKHPELIKQYQQIEQKLNMANKNLLSLVSARESFQLEMAQKGKEKKACNSQACP